MKKYLTPQGLKKIKKELDYLKTVRRKEIAERLRVAISFGDLKENAAYHETKEAQGFLEGRILELQETLKDVQIIEKRGIEYVQIGSMVSINSKNSEEKFEIVGPEEVNPIEGKISYLSPIGNALLKKAVGEKIEIETSEGKIEYKISKIE